MPTERDRSEPLRCSWCDRKFGTARAVMDHEAEHRREEIAEAERRAKELIAEAKVAP